MTTDIVPIGNCGLVPRTMDEAMRLAEFMSRARTVPKHLQDSPGDCLMAIEQAMRWGMSPFAVAQATSVISGKLMFEGKLVAAAVETSGAIVGQLEYEFSGEGETRAVKVSGTRRGETNPRAVTIALKDARTNNEMWKRQPDQQLVYHGARVWARRWTPAVILGVYSREEMGPIIEGQIATDAPVPEPTPAPVPETPPAPPEPDYAAIVAKFEAAAARVGDSDEARKLLEWKPGVIAITALPNGAERNRYMQLRSWVQTSWLSPQREMAPESEMADSGIEGL